MKEFTPSSLTHRGWTVIIDIEDRGGVYFAFNHATPDTQGRKGFWGHQRPDANPPYAEAIQRIDFLEDIGPKMLVDDLDEVAFDLFKQIANTGHATINRNGVIAHVCFREGCDGNA